MSRKLQLTFACGDYEIMRALKEGIVRPEGIELTVLTDMGPSPRHWRFLRGREFDIAEVSGSGYVAARDQDLPFRAIPVFPHRRFRHGFIFVNTAKGISKPTDLIGRKVGTKGYLFTAGLVDARHSRTRLRRAAQVDQMAERARRGCRLHAAARPRHHADTGGRFARRHAGRG